MQVVKIAVVVLGLIGFAFSILLSFLSKKLKVKEDPRVEKVIELLPGLNCGACGFSGCRAYAEAVVKECKIFSGCLPGGKSLNDQIAESLGLVGCVSVNKQIVICHCGANANEKNKLAAYAGPQTCKAAHTINGGVDCNYGCLAFGDCLEVCPTKALSLEQDKINVNIPRCIGCGKCTFACPRKLFELIPFEKQPAVYYVACSNKEKAIDTRRVCKKGCISCGICVKPENSPYCLNNNLSVVDYQKENDEGLLDKGKSSCPTKCIVKANV